MPTRDLVLRRSPARRRFKDLLGNANHFLITLLVGLEAVANGQAQIPMEFSTSWNPHDRVRSAQRSREFALRGALTSTCDALDAYLRLINRSPFVLQDDDTRQALSDRGRSSLTSRLQVVADHSGDACDAAAIAMAQFAIARRNHLVHTVGDDPVDPRILASLVKHREQIFAEYQGVVVEQMVERVVGSHARIPTFKETTAFIRAAHRVVGDVDCFLLGNFAPQAYFEEWLSAHVKGRDDRLVRTWGKDPRSKPGRVLALAHQAGFGVAPDSDEYSRNGPGLDIHGIAAWTVIEARSRLSRPGEQ